MMVTICQIKSTTKSSAGMQNRAIFKFPIDSPEKLRYTTLHISNNQAMIRSSSNQSGLQRAFPV